MTRFLVNRLLYVADYHLQSDLTDEKMEEFFHFWREDFKFEHRELGCAIQCMSRHFNLLTDSSRMHHDNTAQFIQSFPNGKSTILLLSSIGGLFLLS